MNEILLALVQTVGGSRIDLAMAEKARLQQEEADRIRREREAEESRIRREREAELKRCRDELRARQDTEQGRFDRLMAVADCWFRSRRLRHYIRAVQQEVMARDGQVAPGAKSTSGYVEQ